VEEIKISTETKSERYQELIPQIVSIISDESNTIANMANIVAALKQSFAYYSWVGFYLSDNTKNELVLGPFQGKIACTRIAFGRGVCGTAFQKKETIIVPNVNEFPGHIFCDGDSKSEIVIPISRNEKIIGVLDVDSYEYNSFDEIDKKYLEILIEQIKEKI
jgi:GAF domain-containing protein